MNRRGLGILGLVVALSAAATVVVLATHGLARSSSRTLFSLQERRVLDALARSALAEAAFTMQAALDGASPAWERWLRDAAPPQPRTVAPAATREAAVDLPQSAGALEYAVADVAVSRMRALGAVRSSGPRAPALVDLEVSVWVRRASPKHEATLKVVERRWVRLAGDLGPFASAGKHLEVASEPVATWEER